MAKTAYVLSKRIARGGMAEIFLGKAVGEDEFQRICAIKRILPHYAQDREFVEMFRDEAHICKRLQHANIVQVYDFTEVEGSYALIMEHVDGADLRTLLSACETTRQRVPVPMALYITACAARGLHYAHTKSDEISGAPLGIVHRDVSPQNILISYEGEIKITDFGIASAESKITETRPGVVKGKYSYMSPEQVMAKSLDARSDVFSLAIVLWECLAMKRLFSGQSEVETIRKVQACEINQKLTELNPNVSDDLMNIIHRGLAKDPKKRFQTAAAFEKTILKYLHSKYPDFIASELGDFLKQILASRREKNQDDIKQTLTGTDLPKGLQKELKSSTKDIVRNSIPPLEQAPKAPEAADIKHGVQLEAPDAQKNGSTKEITLSHPPRSTMSHVTRSAVRNATNYSSVVASPQPIYKRIGRAQKKQASLLAPLMLIIALASYLIFSGKDTSDGKLNLELKSRPNVVQLSLNGKRLKNGAFVRTPISLDLPPGKYQMTMDRPGYRSETITFQGGANDSLRPAPIIMRREPEANMMTVKITGSGARRMFVNFNNDFAKGPTPLTVRDVKADMVHTVNFSYVDGDDKRMMKCTFRPSNREQVFNIDIQVSKDGKIRCVGRAQ